MLYRVASDLVIVVHFAWIAFLILGFPICLYLKLRTWRIVHLVALIGTVVMQLTGAICPLTYLEACLKSHGTASAVYPGQFIGQAVERLIYVEDVTLETVTKLTIVFLTAVLLSFWLRPIRFKRSNATP